MNMAQTNLSESNRSADVQVCCIAGFQTRAAHELARPADLEIGDTAGLETCATFSARGRKQSSLCFGPPSPRPSPPGEGEAFARPEHSDIGRAVAAPQFFNAANVRTISAPGLPEACRRFSLSPGERAGVRASVVTILSGIFGIQRKGAK